jgi:hypothetical protein
MSLFGALKRVARGVVDVALLPIDAAIDIATGEIGVPRAQKRANKIVEDAEQTYEETLRDE